MTSLHVNGFCPSDFPAPFVNGPSASPPASVKRRKRRFDPVDLKILADRDCANCGGRGLLDNGGSQELPHCPCALREAFQQCFHAYRDLATVQSLGGELASSLGRSGNHVTRIKYGRPPPQARHLPLGFCRTAECYMADVFLLARRSLLFGEWDHRNVVGPEIRWRLFRRRFLRGCDKAACLKATRMGRNRLSRVLDRIETSVGREFYQVQPYPLWPPSEY